MKIRHHRAPPTSAAHHTRTTSTAAAAAATPATRPHVVTDGFDDARRRPVDLAGAPTARPVEAQLVKTLYQLIERLRQLLSTPGLPTTGGATAPAAASSSVGGAAPSATDSFRQLIAADIKLASGREATDADYAYWLPKLQGPCDSGFVTSGQMTGTEYWHRRLLGWQAGGSDVATSGPYAGGAERGPVPSVADMVGPLPPW